jgi:hypothetical protein
MWSQHWASRYWARRYWPTPTESTVSSSGCGAYGDGSLYGDGGLYCSSSSRRGPFETRYDATFHYVSIRIQATGRFILDTILPLVRIKKV